MSKYAPLQEFLASRASSEVPMSFSEVERILGFDLPASARAHAQWWSNNPGSHVGVRAWRDAGRRTSRVDVGGERVVFVRDETGPHATTGPDAPIVLAMSQLEPSARKLVEDYANEADGDRSAAVVRALQEAALARRNRLIDEIMARAPRIPAGEPDSVALIREDRDAR